MTERTFRHSFKVWAQDQGWPQLREVWIEADRGGFWDAVWLNDHLYPPRGEETRPIMDGWTLFGGLAAITSRIRFGTMLTANTFRHPALLAKQAVTLDHMSQGRLELGVGAGWHEREHEAFGIDLPPIRERFDALDETFQILHGLMTEEVFDFEGKHRTITSARFEPKPVQKPRPPFVVGGSGPRRTIPLARTLGRPVELPGLHVGAPPLRLFAETSRRGVRGDRARPGGDRGIGPIPLSRRRCRDSGPRGDLPRPGGGSRAGQLHAADEHRPPSPDCRGAGGLTS